jgi:hypothetical protein
METFAPGQLVQHACSIIQDTCTGYLYGISERIMHLERGASSGTRAIRMQQLVFSLFLKTSSMMDVCMYTVNARDLYP